MVTDVYGVVERRGKDGRWRFVEPLEIRRSPVLFGVLAGVGGTGHSPIAPPRGLPADLDPASCMDDDEQFGVRDQSWLTLAELLTYDWGALLAVEGHTGACAKFVEWIVYQDAPPDELRIVFGFDH